MELWNLCKLNLIENRFGNRTTVPLPPSLNTRRPKKPSLDRGLLRVRELARIEAEHHVTTIPNTG